MNTAYPLVGSDYAAGYAKGRHAAKENVSAARNPFRRGTAAHQAWSDGYYDEKSARHLAIARHSAELWSQN